MAASANLGGIAGGPVAASHHNEKLVPVSILMALIGYDQGLPGTIDDGTTTLKTNIYILGNDAISQHGACVTSPARPE